MLSPTGWWLALAPVDLRCGIDRLLVAVQATLGRDAFDGGAFVFRNRAGTRIKVLVVDATGVWPVSYTHLDVYKRQLPDR